MSWDSGPIGPPPPFQPLFGGPSASSSSPVPATVNAPAPQYSNSDGVSAASNAPASGTYDASATTYNPGTGQNGGYGNVLGHASQITVAGPSSQYMDSLGNTHIVPDAEPNLGTWQGRADGTRLHGSGELYRDDKDVFTFVDDANAQTPHANYGRDLGHYHNVAIHDPASTFQDASGNYRVAPEQNGNQGTFLGHSDVGSRVVGDGEAYYDPSTGIATLAANAGNPNEAARAVSIGHPSSNSRGMDVTNGMDTSNESSAAPAGAPSILTVNTHP